MHTFTLRDDNQQHYHRAVALKESPYYVALAWRAERGSPVHDLGIYRLDLLCLLQRQHIRVESPQRSDQVRVRFFRAADGWIYIQANIDAPALKVIKSPI